MPRKPRIEYPGAVYHVMSRGNRQEAICRDNKDREMFLDTLEEACNRTGWVVHAFVLIGYDENRRIFHVANSWGEDWGTPGKTSVMRIQEIV